MFKNKNRLTGSMKLNDPIMIIGIIVIAVIVSYIIGKGGIKAAVILGAIPVVIVYLNRLFVKPSIGLYTTMILSFLVIGITRYIPGVPLGLAIDGILVLTFVALFFKNFYSGFNINAFKNDLTILMFVWFLYSIAQIFNPEALSKTAWFYAMRGMSLYSLLAIPLVFLAFNKVKHFYTFLYIWGFISILGTLKGFQQLYIGPDYAEQRWLDTIGSITHMLFGELRVFSFYSDAGQFGAAQGAAGILGLLIFFNVKDTKQKVFFLIVGLTGIYGMFISGTRGAIITPLVGAMIYLIHRKNIRVIFFGILMLAGVYVFFKYTYIGQGNAQIRRMRTAFNPEEDASLQVRLENRKILQVYLASRPFGGGIGSAGDWGKRFSPNGFLANVATDSWFVQIWAEQGIVGLLLHIFILSYIAVKGSYYIMFKVKDPELRGKLSAAAAAYAGIIGASYGNGVLGQMPTGILTYFTWGFLFIAPYLDQEITESKKELKA
jgi:hypothetical protein